jgi:hypothetical protein
MKSIKQCFYRSLRAIRRFLTNRFNLLQHQIVALSGYVKSIIIWSAGLVSLQLCISFYYTRI